MQKYLRPCPREPSKKEFAAVNVFPALKQVEVNPKENPDTFSQYPYPQFTRKHTVTKPSA